MNRRATIGYGLGVIFAAGGPVCWSLGGALVRLTRGLDVWQIIFYRSSVLLVCILAWFALAHRGRFTRQIADAGINGVIAGLACGIAGLTFIGSLFYVTVAQSIFMVGVSPFLSAIIGYWILREAIPGITWLAMTVALIGLGIMLSGNIGSASLIGAALAIYSAFAFSCYSVLLRWGQNTDMNAALIWNALFLIVVSAIVLMVPNPLRSGSGLAEFNIGLDNFLLCFLMGAVQLGLGLALFTLGSRSVPAAQLSLIALVEPTISPIWAWLAVSELPPILTFVGGAVILAAIAAQALFSARRRKPAYVYEPG
jgi:drug/metabolite transporter (DMT)-like permease